MTPAQRSPLLLPGPPSCNSHCFAFLPFKCLSKIIIMRNRIKTDFLPKYITVHTRNLILLVFKYIRCLQIPQRQSLTILESFFSKSIRFKAGIKSRFSSPTQSPRSSRRAVGASKVECRNMGLHDSAPREMFHVWAGPRQ